MRLLNHWKMNINSFELFYRVKRQRSSSGSNNATASCRKHDGTTVAEQQRARDDPTTSASLVVKRATASAVDWWLWVRAQRRRHRTTGLVHERVACRRASRTVAGARRRHVVGLRPRRYECHNSGNRARPELGDDQIVVRVLHP